MQPPLGESTRAMPTWSRPRQAVVLFVRGATAPAAWHVAVVVGTILSVVNQGATVAAGDASLGTWLRVGFNYLVPYVVASIGFLKACRRSDDSTPPEAHANSDRQGRMNGRREATDGAPAAPTDRGLGRERARRPLSRADRSSDRSRAPRR